MIKINEFILSGNTFRSKQCKHLISLFKEDIKENMFLLCNSPSSLSETTGEDPSAGALLCFYFGDGVGVGENEIDDAFTTGKTKKLHIIIQPCE